MLIHLKILVIYWKSIDELTKKYNMPIIISTHPRTRQKLGRYWLSELKIHSLGFQSLMVFMNITTCR